ncbi:MAG: hypothetical protein M0Q47_00540 [Methanothrix sp.]|uniref:hypothetical protein n=1 Tax=Methanothrix sp. TaxID=90426 RepID=UPI0025E03CAE|nr:hypothetical protein [Methanothrix sp.]MCK9404889.1 hypothetical protein [Methanothrix sp.]MDD4488803.1 hypothetical protein [Methanothrix soehngenii]
MAKGSKMLMIRSGYSGGRRAVAICADQVGCVNEMVSSLYDRVTLINRDGNMRDQYNYFEVFRLD